MRALPQPDELAAAKLVRDLRLRRPEAAAAHERARCEAFAERDDVDARAPFAVRLEHHVEDRTVVGDPALGAEFDPRAASKRVALVPQRHAPPAELARP